MVHGAWFVVRSGRRILPPSFFLSCNASTAPTNPIATNNATLAHESLRANTAINVNAVHTAPPTQKTVALVSK